MGATRLPTTSEAEYQRHRDYYLANKTRLLTNAKARYAVQGPALRRAAQKIRDLAREERLRLKSKRGPNKAVERAKAFVLKEKTGKSCLDCHTPYPPYVLDFDHVRGTKRADISSLVWKGRSPSMIAAEIAKCDLVCANCHRIRTFTRTSA